MSTLILHAMESGEKLNHVWFYHKGPSLDRQYYARLKSTLGLGEIFSDTPSRGLLGKLWDLRVFTSLPLYFNKNAIFYRVVDSNKSKCMVTRPNRHELTPKSFLTYTIYHKLKQLFIKRDTHYSCDEITRNSICHSSLAMTSKMLTSQMCMFSNVETCG